MDKIDQFIKYVDENYLGGIKTNLAFKDVTTLKIGGQIGCLYFPKNLDDLITSFRYLIKNQIKYFVIGSGSNILAADKKFEMVVISLKNLNKIIKLTTDKFWVEAGIKDNKLAIELAKEGYTKMEFLSIIPGTIGGAIYMNAGAYDAEMQDIIQEVIYLDEKGFLQFYKKEEAEFAYRKSIFQKRKGIIVGAIIQVEKANIQGLPLEKIATLKKKKKENQPLNLLSAGSTFKNGKSYEAWKIIDELGYRGYQLKGAMVSKSHTNFLINTGNATYIDMTQLIAKIKLDAFQKYKINLECEWEILD